MQETHASMISLVKDVKRREEECAGEGATAATLSDLLRSKKADLLQETNEYFSVA